MGEFGEVLLLMEENSSLRKGSGGVPMTKASISGYPLKSRPPSRSLHLLNNNHHSPSPTPPQFFLLGGMLNLHGTSSQMTWRSSICSENSNWSPSSPAPRILISMIHHRLLRNNCSSYQKPLCGIHHYLLSSSGNSCSLRSSVLLHSADAEPPAISGWRHGHPSRASSLFPTMQQNDLNGSLVGLNFKQLGNGPTSGLTLLSSMQLIILHTTSSPSSYCNQIPGIGFRTQAMVKALWEELQFTLPTTNISV